uniref:Uncharacterized protein TCIL3000_11_6660 n=1 Tax=Trypanosoma congolense (strain IL3000) TaxID=1068625 RepID=G0V0R9_TRYCI|nr:unnamed protein product [Trypanosoma congolense IL3000]
MPGPAEHDANAAVATNGSGNSCIIPCTSQREGPSASDAGVLTGSLPVNVLSRTTGENGAYRTVDSDRKVPFMDLFKATAQRSFRQTIHRKSEVLLELIVPLLFISVTIILWSLWGTNEFDETTYLDHKGLPPTLHPAFYHHYICSKLEGGVPGVGPCANLSELECLDSNITAPFDGFCVYANTGVESLQNIFLGGFRDRIAPVPSLDTVIMQQWLARKLNYRVLLPGGTIPNNPVSAIQSSGKLYFAGERGVLKGITQHLASVSRLFESVYGGMFDTLEEAEEEVRQNSRNWGIIHVRGFGPRNLDVRIFLNASALPPLATTVANAYPGGSQPNRAEMYALSGYLTLQKEISEYHRKSFGVLPDVAIDSYVMPMGSVEYIEAPLLKYARDTLPFLLSSAYLFSVTSRMHSNVIEKERNIRETMLIMGMRNSVLNTVWFLKPVIIDLLVCCSTTIMLKLTYMTQSDPFSIFVVFFAFTMTTIPLAGLLSCFFSKTRVALLATPIIYFLMLLPYAVEKPKYGVSNIIYSLFSPTAFICIVRDFAARELSGGFRLLHHQASEDRVTAELMLIMMASDFVIYLVLMIYFGAVIPGEYGAPKHPLYFVHNIVNALGIRRVGGSKPSGVFADGRAEDGVYEEMSTIGDEASVTMKGLRKVYRRDGKFFVAVNDFCWSLNKGEISVLLGLNGAGKSTIMKMLTGMVKPDGGDCYVYGRSVTCELPAVRRMMGYCPQHNILWPELTCREHLEFFCKIKGLKGKSVDSAVQQILCEIDLVDKADDAAMHLSGGQKRKLSLGIAFVGGSPLVMLDEPTAGMDTTSRTHTWRFLQRRASRHTILLTTHYMDEADLLGHRTAILSEGRLKCSGSSLFLKSKLGLGYSLTVVLRSLNDFDALNDMVCSQVADAKLNSHSGCEVMYRLPSASVGHFPHLIELMETTFASKLGSYSLAATTLEEVFLIASGGSGSPSSEPADYSSLWKQERIKGWYGAIQFKASMMKRINTALRDHRMHCLQFLCLFSVMLATMLLSFSSVTVDSLLFTSDLYSEKVLVDSGRCDTLWGGNPEAQNAHIRETHKETTMELSKFGIQTWFSHHSPRYAAISCGDPSFRVLQRDTYPVVMLHNSSAVHQAPVTMGLFYQLLLQKALGSPVNVSWSVGVMKDKQTYVSAKKLMMISTLIMIPVALVSSNPVEWIVKERECGALHLQKMAGLWVSVYWISNFFFDIAMYILSAIIIVVTLVAFNQEEYVGRDTAVAFIVALLLYGLTGTVFGYVLSFLFRQHSRAHLIVMGLNFVLGLLLITIVNVLSMLPKTRETSKNLRWGFRFIPSFSVCEAIARVSYFRHGRAVGNVASIYELDAAGPPLLFLAAEFPIFALLVLLLDHPRRRAWWARRYYNRSITPEKVNMCDSDVEEESVKASSLPNDNGCVALRVANLSKVYRNGKVAVRGVSFLVPPGEVFALLGTNGAGKTTTISILCQEFMPTGGTVEIGGYDIVYKGSKALRCTGYCPQFDACISLLSVEEHLRLFLAIRGIEGEAADRLVNSLLHMCDLTKFRRSLSCDLSGGNRRKLSLAIAVIGGPCVIFLDEPTAGMDPVSRRKIWFVIQRAAAHCAVVLTTHHMEEVGAVAQRVAIMKDGVLLCIGSNARLKEKYGAGYEMCIRVVDGVSHEGVEGFVAEKFPEACLREHKGRQFVYSLPSTTSLADTFRTLESNKQRLSIEDYSVSQATIERVFLLATERSQSLPPQQCSEFQTV